MKHPLVWLTEIKVGQSVERTAAFMEFPVCEAEREVNPDRFAVACGDICT